MFYNRPEILDILAANNLKFVADENGKPLLDLSRKQGILTVEPTAPEPYTPNALYAALDGAERAEKEFMKTNKRELSTDNKPKDSDYKAARLLAAHLTGKSLNMLAKRGLHGRNAGDRLTMEDAVTDLLYKGTFGRDLYTNTPIINMGTQMGHTTANSLGGKELRQELSPINTSLKDSEGEERLEAIRRKRVQLNAMKAVESNPELFNDPEIRKLVLGDKTFLNDFTNKAKSYGFNISDAEDIIQSGKDLQSTGSVVGQKPFVINADEGANVYVHTNGNGNAKDHAIMQEKFNRRRR